jgi:hypothetical protein
VTHKAKDRTAFVADLTRALAPRLRALGVPKEFKVDPFKLQYRPFVDPRFEKVPPLEHRFREAKSKNERKRAIRKWVQHFMHECKRAGVRTDIPAFLLAMEELHVEGAPLYKGRRLKVIGLALLASEARRKVADPKTNRDYTKEKADAWTWAKLPLKDRALFDPKGERLDMKPDSRRIEKWRRLLRRHGRSKIVVDESFVAQSWLDLDHAVRTLSKLRSPPAPAHSWEDAAEQIISGALILWKPAAPAPPKRPMSGRSYISKGGSSSIQPMPATRRPGKKNGGKPSPAN